MRLDTFLVERGEFASRNKAAEAIRAGRVSVGGRQISKPSYNVGSEDEVVVAEGEEWVSRAAGKLAGYLREHPVAIAGKTCLDIGSSTGGFTQVLLRQGAERVDAVDVGREQLHLSLRNDPKVRVYESTDIRDFEPESRYPIIVSDVSFISLSHILPSVIRLAEERAEVILLFKPQFEVGREAKRDRRGVVTDERVIAAAMERFEQETAALGWE
ncbi:23S rRNA (cytidine-2'-O)-methyltransferase TlyA, partial [Nitratifractor sp.]